MIGSAKQRFLGIAIIILSVIPVKAAAVLAAPSEDKSANHSSEDENIIRTQADAYAKAFSVGDANTLANMWTADGVYTDSAGRRYSGIEGIQKLFESYFKQYGSQPLEISIQSIKFPTLDTAIEEGTTRLLEGNLPGNKTHYMIFHVKRNGQWKMAAVSETPCPASSGSEYLKDLSWLIGNWTVKDPPSTDVHLKAGWIADHNFIRCDYSISGADGSVTKETQIVGWDPISGHIVSWHFDSNGGFGYGKWIKQGPSWNVITHSIQPDGIRAYANYTYHLTNSDIFTWQSTKRSLGGRTLPNTETLTIARDTFDDSIK